MRTTHVEQEMAFYSLLAAATRSVEIPESADVYGWLCGSWDLEVLHYRGINVAARGLQGEVHAARVLEGRAIQDVWIMPRCEDRHAHVDEAMNMYGTTLRSCDADPGLAYRVDESGARTSRGTDRPVERQGHSSGGHACGWHEDALDLHGDHSGCLSLAW